MNLQHLAEREMSLFLYFISLGYLGWNQAIKSPHISETLRVIYWDSEKGNTASQFSPKFVCSAEVGMLGHSRQVFTTEARLFNLLNLTYALFPENCVVSSWDKGYRRNRTWDNVSGL